MCVVEKLVFTCVREYARTSEPARNIHYARDRTYYVQSRRSISKKKTKERKKNIKNTLARSPFNCIECVLVTPHTNSASEPNGCMRWQTSGLRTVQMVIVRNSSNIAQHQQSQSAAVGSQQNSMDLASHTYCSLIACLYRQAQIPLYSTAPLYW